jgi:transcriptional regulatory protein RtcR
MLNLIGFLGVQKDSRGYNEKRWKKFRPSVGLCMHEGLSFDNYYILYQNKFINQLNFLIEDIKSVAPDLNIIPVAIDFDDLFDPVEALEKQLNFVSGLPEDQEYLINLTTGTHTNQLAWFKLVENNFINAKLVQAFGTGGEKQNSTKLTDNDLAKGHYRIIDFKLEKYDRYFSLMNKEKVSSESFLKFGIHTLNHEYNKMITMIERIAVKNNHPILVDGPNGAGKTNLIKNIYDLKKSKSIVKGDFQSINCATLRSENAQSVLFGHKKGAFTGAVQDRKGLISLADSGILFLDEIGTLSMDVQGMLLHVLEDGSYYPMGSDKLVTSDFVLFCGTNINLYEEVEKGNFREDLLARINLWHFTLPGLKDRKEDIEPNLLYELKKTEKTIGVKTRFNDDAKNNFVKFSISDQALWKRNFRDLSSAVIRMVTLSDNGIITTEVVNEEIERLKASWGIGSVKTNLSDNKCLDRARELIGDSILNLSKIDIMVLEETINACVNSNSATEAAKSLYENINGEKLSMNPSGRLNKYLSKFDLSYKIISNNY